MGEAGCSVGVPALKVQFILLALYKLRIACAVRDVMCMVYYVHCIQCIVCIVQWAVCNVQRAVAKGLRAWGGPAEVLGEKSLGKWNYSEHPFVPELISTSTRPLTLIDGPKYPGKSKVQEKSQCLVLLGTAKLTRSKSYLSVLNMTGVYAAYGRLTCGALIKVNFSFITIKSNR